LAIAEKLNAPVITTTAGKGAVPEDHPLCAGYRLGLAAGVEFLRGSDCILCAGSELSETDFWDDNIVLDRNLIRIDIDPASLARPHTAELAILGDAGPTLAAIAARLKGTRAKPRAEFDRLRAITPVPSREVLAKVLSAIREALPRDTVVCSDMTQIAYAANEHFDVYEPRSWIHPVGFGTLGFALPVAIGAKFSRPTAPVACMIGDYGIQYTINELGTVAEHKLPVVILMWNNERLGAIHDDMVGKGIQPNAVTLKNPDFQMLAKSYGVHAEKPTSLKALAVAIKTALAADGPTLIEMTPRMVNG
ncbi:MAG: hypothetical protein FJX63_01570, partial [Alphaproteobacteria bacterium]|nr:hypothetical protein [Alphaproteobacteria bacterium]